MDFGLSEQERMLQASARQFAREVVAPQAAEIDRSGAFPVELAREMGRLGYLGLPYPVQYGGSGAGYSAYALAIEQISQASLTAGAIVAVSVLPEECIYRFGNEAQKQRYLAPLAAGRVFGCFAFTEPATGSDPRAITTKATPEGAGYRIEGRKNFISLSPVAALALLFARDDTGRVSAFVVDTASPGFVVGPPMETLGLRGMGTSEVYLEGLHAPQENMIGDKGKGYDILLEAISMERIGVSAQGVGLAQAALDQSIGYARQRLAGGRPIAQLPTIQWLVAEMASRLEAGRWLAYHTAYLRDRGADVKRESAEAKLFCSQMAVEVSRMALQVHGAYGVMKTMPVERLYRDAKMLEIYVGVSEIQRVIIASYLLKG